MTIHVIRWGMLIKTFESEGIVWEEAWTGTKKVGVASFLSITSSAVIKGVKIGTNFITKALSWNNIGIRTNANIIQYSFLESCHFPFELMQVLSLSFRADASKEPQVSFSSSLFFSMRYNKRMTIACAITSSSVTSDPCFT